MIFATKSLALPSAAVFRPMPRPSCCALLPIGRGRAKRNIHLPMILTHTQQSGMIKCSIYLADTVEIAVAHSPRLPSLTRIPTYGKKVGDLNQARYYHDATFIQGTFLIVGTGLTEKCELTGNLMKCVQQEPNIIRYG